jgi:hypothetical protein
MSSNSPSSQSVTQSFDNWINNTYLKANAKPTLTPKQAKIANVNMLRNQDGPSGKNVFKDINYTQIQALAPTMVVKGKGDNPGGQFNAAWTSLWKECQDKSQYERLAALEKRYASFAGPFLFFGFDFWCRDPERAITEFNTSFNTLIRSGKLDGEIAVYVLVAYEKGGKVATSE